MPAQDSSAPQGQPGVRRIAVRFFLLIEILSFCEDFTYEGSHSILGPYLEALGATAMVVGALSRSRILVVNPAPRLKTTRRKINKLEPPTWEQISPKMAYSWRV